ncbi:MAG: hypothetical protein ACTSWC_12880 [Promethearchaeota archaeon]
MVDKLPSRGRSSHGLDTSNISFYLPHLFGNTVQVRILEILLKLLFFEEKDPNGKLQWMNISEIARAVQSSKSAAKKILDRLVDRELIEEKKIITHAQTPPRYFRINSKHPAIRDLVFFYTKVRGAL